MYGIASAGVENIMLCGRLADMYDAQQSFCYNISHSGKTGKIFIYLIVEEKPERYGDPGVCSAGSGCFLQASPCLQKEFPDI